MKYSWKGVRITDSWQFGNGPGVEEPSETYVFYQYIHWSRTCIPWLEICGSFHSFIPVSLIFIKRCLDPSILCL